MTLLVHGEESESQSLQTKRFTRRELLHLLSVLVTTGYAQHVAALMPDQTALGLMPRKPINSLRLTLPQIQTVRQWIQLILTLSG